MKVCAKLADEAPQTCSSSCFTVGQPTRPMQPWTTRSMHRVARLSDVCGVNRGVRGFDSRDVGAHRRVLGGSAKSSRARQESRLRHGSGRSTRRARSRALRIASAVKRISPRFLPFATEECGDGGNDGHPPRHVAFHRCAQPWRRRVLAPFARRSTQVRRARRGQGQPARCPSYVVTAPRPGSTPPIEAWAATTSPTPASIDEIRIESFALLFTIRSPAGAGARHLRGVRESVNSLALAVRVFARRTADALTNKFTCCRVVRAPSVPMSPEEQ